MEYSNMLQRAYQFAQIYHAGQMYGDKEYMYHLKEVAYSLSRMLHNGDEYLIVAYLHDILEDTACTEATLRENFSYEIVDAVVAMTKVEGENYLTYIKKVSLNKIAHTVKIHDTLANLTESVKSQDWRRIDKYANQLGLLAQIA